MPKFRQQIASDVLYDSIWQRESLAHEIIVLSINSCWTHIVCYKVHSSGKPGNWECIPVLEKSWKNAGNLGKSHCCQTFLSIWGAGQSVCSLYSLQAGKSEERPLENNKNMSVFDNPGKILKFLKVESLKPVLVLFLCDLIGFIWLLLCK